MRFLNKSVIVTGASSGIGAAVAKQFTKEGANVAIIARNETKLKNVAEECERIAKKPLVIRADLTKDDEVKDIVKETINKFGSINVLINNAAMGKYGSILNGFFFDTYDITMNTNVRAAALLTSLCVPHLIKTKGNIVNVSSVAATSIPRKPAHISYFLSKAALNHFSRCAAAELASVGVRVNVVSPGPTRTDLVENSGGKTPWEKYEELTALKRLSEPEEIADIILYVASDKAKSATGSVLVFDNGFLIKR